MPNVILKEQTYDRIRKGVDLANRFLPPRPVQDQRTIDHDKRVWYKCVPDTAGVQLAPAYGVIQIVSVTLDASQLPIVRYKRPDADSVLNTAIIYGQDIPAGSVSGAEGLCTLEPAFALYNTA